MLLIHSRTDVHSRYSHYLAEIVRSEGFVDCAEAELSGVDEATLAQHDLVLLPRLTPTQAQAELLATYVARGGRLIACLPAANLISRLGLRPTFHGVDSGYLRLVSTEPIWQGACLEPLQIIGPTVAWALVEGANVTVLAYLHSEPERSTELTGFSQSRALDNLSGLPPASGDIPALITSRIGQGQAVLLAYDLPQTVARLRQGNPAHADLCFAGLDGIYRPSELFVGQLDPRQAHLPQADLHAALLARLIEHLAPRPRLWYYPQAGQRSVMIMTSDDDWSRLDQFESLLAGLRRRGVHCTFYITPKSQVTRKLMDTWEQEGHTFSVHPALDGDFGGLATDDPQRLTVAAMIEQNIARHQQEYGRTPRTIRQHAIRWLGYVEAAYLLAERGLKMDLNYLNVYPFTLGYLAGSGRPLRFVDTDGTIIPYFQQPTHWTEETLIHPKFVFSLKWSVEKALAETGQIIQRAGREFYTPFALNSHPVSFATYSSPLVERVWDAALAEGLPIISADEWLAWTEARDQIRLELGPNGWLLSSEQAIPHVTVLWPEQLSLQAEGQVSRQHLWGQTYTAVTLSHIAAGVRRRIEYQ
jgi:hypothetical protein